MIKVIGFTGVKKSGKTTAFDAIKAIYPSVIEIQLAKKLKDVCSEVLKIPRKHLDDQRYKEKPFEEPIYLEKSMLKEIVEAYGHRFRFTNQARMHVGVLLETPRRAAQYIGTEVLRELSEDIHCEGAIMGLPKEGIFVVTDMRFPNEFHFFNNHYRFFYPFYIQRTREELNGAKDMHPSEKLVFETAKSCIKITNNNSRGEFERKVQDLAREIV